MKGQPRRRRSTEPAARPSRRPRDRAAFKIHPDVQQVEPADLTRELIATCSPIPYPEPGDRPRYAIERNALGADYTAQLRGEIAANESRFFRRDFARRADWSLANVKWPALDVLKAKLVADCDRAADAIGVDRFDISRIEMHAIGYHDGDRISWHTDHYSSSGYVAEETRRLTYCYYLQEEPREWTGGGHELFDGTVLPHEDDMLVWSYPYQIHRVRPVEGWSPSFIHGRWTVTGWLH